MVPALPNPMWLDTASAGAPRSEGFPCHPESSPSLQLEEEVNGDTGQWRGRGIHEKMLQGDPEDFAVWLSRAAISLLPPFSVCFCVRW